MFETTQSSDWEYGCLLIDIFPNKRAKSPDWQIFFGVTYQQLSTLDTAKIYYRIDGDEKSLTPVTAEHFCQSFTDPEVKHRFNTEGEARACAQKLLNRMLRKARKKYPEASGFVQNARVSSNYVPINNRWVPDIGIYMVTG